MKLESLNVHQYKVEECAEFEKTSEKNINRQKWTVCTRKESGRNNSTGIFFRKNDLTERKRTCRNYQYK